MKPKKCISKISAYTTKLFDEVGFLKLDSNESDFGCSPKVLETLRNIEVKDLQYYPYYGEFLEKLSKFHNVGLENVIATAGADESINAIFSTFLESGQSVLSVRPSFIMPKLYAQLNGVKYIEVPYQKKWEFPIDEFLEKIVEADLIHITTPNSPTGEMISEQNIARIVEKANGKAILIDETYMNYGDATNLELVKTNENIFIVRSFSKDFALAGLRLGYVISHAENIVSLRKQLSPYNVSTLTTKAGISALEDFDFFQGVKKAIEISKTELKNGLEKLGAKVYDSQTNFLCVDFGIKAEFVYKKLYLNKIKVKYFGESGELANTLRIGVPRLSNTYRILDVLERKPTIVFDMDGVLIDTSNSYRLAIKETVEYFTGSTISLEQIQSAKNLGGLNNDWDLTQYLIGNAEIESEKIIKKFQDLYWAKGGGLIKDERCLVDEGFIKELSKDYNLAIFTGRPKSEAMFALEHNNIAQYFFPIITMDDLPLNRQKPDSLGLEIIKEKVMSDKIYYLGDTQDDMKCARGACVIGVGVLPPQDKSQDLRTRLGLESPLTILDETRDLEEFLRCEESNEIEKH